MMFPAKKNLMKSIQLSLATLCLVCSSFVVAKAQSLDEIVQKAVAAMGGAENLRKIKTLTTIGTMDAGNGVQIGLKMTAVHMTAMRLDLTYGGMNGYNIVTQKGGWTFMPFNGQTKAEPLTGDALKEEQTGLDCQGDLLDYKDKGTKVVYLGKDDIEGTTCHKLKLTRKTGSMETVYLDAKTFLAIRSVKKRTIDGKEIEQVVNFGDYTRLPEGIMEPKFMQLDGVKMNFTEFEVNKPVAESIFVPTN